MSMLRICHVTLSSLRVKGPIMGVGGLRYLYGGQVKIVKKVRIP